MTTKAVAYAVRNGEGKSFGRRALRRCINHSAVKAPLNLVKAVKAAKAGSTGSTSLNQSKKIFSSIDPARAPSLPALPLVLSSS